MQHCTVFHRTNGRMNHQRKEKKSMKNNTAPKRFHHRSDLVRIATEAMLDRQLLAEFSSRVIEELALIEKAADDTDPAIRDLRDLLWCSIDNDDSMDLDQLTYLEPLDAGKVRLLVAKPMSMHSSKKAQQSMATRITTRRRSIPPGASFRCCPSACPTTSVH
jgi:hypothetical protein